MLNTNANKTMSQMNLVKILKNFLVLTVLATLLLIGILAIVGFWNSESPRYWRNAAQSLLFFGARHAPQRFTASVTRSALKINSQRTSYEELKEAASLFLDCGETEAAAALWLALARIDGASNDVTQGLRHAHLSYTTSPNSGALVALVVLNSNDSEQRNTWSTELQTKYPEHELSKITLCLAQLQSLEGPVPEPCQQVSWLLEKVTTSKTEFGKLKRQIEDLPKVAQANAQKYENEVTQRDTKAGYYYLDVQAIERKKSEVRTKAVLQALLPLPKNGDTAGSYIAREGICLLPVIRWACLAASVSESASEAQKELKQLDEQRRSVQELIRLNHELRQYAMDKLEYWRSSEPLKELTEAKRNVLPKFQADVEKAIVEMRHNLGLSIEDAVFIATT